MKTINKIKLLLFFMVFLSLKSFSQSNYLNDILKLETSFSKQQFLDTILKIPFDKALSNVNNYLKLTKKAEEIALELKDEHLLAVAYSKQSLSHHFTSNYDLAVEYTIKAALLFEKNNDIVQFGSSYLDLGWRINRRELDKGISYMRKGIKILENYDKSSKKLIGGYNNFGVLKHKKNELDSALFYHEKSLNLCQKTKDSIGIPFALIHMAEVYLKKKNYIKTKTLLDQAMSIRKQRNDIYGIADTYLYYGDYYHETKEYNQAISAYMNGYNLANTNSYYPLKQYAVTNIIKSFEAKKDYKNANKFLKINQQLKDSVLNTKTNNKIAQLEIEFKTQEREKTLAQQKEKILENELKIKNRNLYAIILSASILILIILSTTYYQKSNYKRKQLEKEIVLKDALATIKTQNKLQEQRLSISRDLHDNIGSQLTFIISSIDNLKYVSKDLNDTLKNKLTHIGEFTTETIQQLRDTIWAMNKNSISVNEFSTRLLSFIEKAKQAAPNINFTYKNTIPTNISFTSVEGMNLFRVTQEAINNAIKYSNATTINIKSFKKGKQLNLIIEDDGKGFDINNISLGNGLSNMEKRMSSINGKVFIKSNPNTGTSIELIMNTTNDV